MEPAPDTTAFFPLNPKSIIGCSSSSLLGLRLRRAVVRLI
jgi:hypothetical protein